jgi:hypothetical protein
MSIELPEIKRLWMMFHGMYGNVLLDKYRTGKLNDKNEDMGILSAQAVWLHDLKAFDFETIQAARDKCRERYKSWPPTSPEFVDLCRAVRPRRAQAPVPELAMSDELKAEIKQRNRQMISELKASRLGKQDFGTGLPALLLMVAKSIGDAGGDEVKSLLQLESTFKPTNPGLGA